MQLITTESTIASMLMNSDEN